MSMVISEKSLCRFFKRLDGLALDMHSVILSHGGKIISEVYYEPFHRGSMHRMFSVTKSFVGLAIGCLAKDGKISLDDSITKYFPEYPTPYEYIKDTTIRNMLMMRTPHEKTTYKADLNGNWVESFFLTKPSHRSGTVFAYDTSASHVLGALVEKITGMPFLDYLRIKFLDAIGFSKEAYCLKDPQGISIGGSGLMATPMDIMRVAQIVMNNGMFNERELIDSEFLREAASCLTSTCTRGAWSDEKQGYGMQIWRTRNNGFMFYGMAGQLALCLRDKDTILVTTADGMGCQGAVQAILDAFWEEIYYKLDSEDYKDNELKEILSNRRVKPIDGEGKDFRGTYVFDKNVMGMKRLSVQTDKNGGIIEYENETGCHTLKFKTGGFNRAVFPYYDCDSITSGAWFADTLTIKSCLIGETVGSVTMELYFNDNEVTVSARSTEKTEFKEFNGIIQGKKK